MFPMNSDIAEQMAKKLANDAKTLMFAQEALHHRWRNLAIEAAGDAFEKALAKGLEFALDVGAFAQLLKQASEVLFSTAKAQLDLERRYEQLKFLASAEGLKIIERKVYAELDEKLHLLPVFQQQVDEIYQRGHQLDMLCHNEITRLSLCTPREPHEDLLPGGEDNLSLKNLDHIRREKHNSVMAEILRKHPDATVLKDRDSGIIVAFGDLDSAKVITTMVSGVGSGEKENWPGLVDRSATLKDALPKDVAVIAWLDYSPPATILEAADADTMPAHLGATKLIEFQHSLNQMYPHARKVVDAHSFGGLTALVATQRPGGLPADLVIVKGSPGGRLPANPGGEPKDSSSVLRYPDQKLVVIDADRDPIGILHNSERGIYGPDPRVYADESVRISGGHSDFIGPPDNTQVTVDQITQLLEK